MLILGIDPGLTGGCVMYDAAAQSVVDAIDIPTSGEKAKKLVNAAEVLRWVVRHSPSHCFFERGQTRPRMNVTAVFNYAKAIGALEAIVGCAMVPLTFVEPSVWKRHHGLTKRDLTTSQVKENSRQRALQLVPSAHKFMLRKGDHGRAEALLIAIYGVTSLPVQGARALAEKLLDYQRDGGRVVFK